jgi:hypothetical protein
MRNAMGYIRDALEILSFIITIFGFPSAIFVFFYEQRKERYIEEDEVYQLLSDNYQEFLKTVLENTDLHLITNKRTEDLSADQRERMLIIFTMLIALFERAYLLLYRKKLSASQRRRWASWDDYMAEWCMREDFYNLLPSLLKGEDPEFSEYIMGIKSRDNG